MSASGQKRTSEHRNYADPRNGFGLNELSGTTTGLKLALQIANPLL